jgi:hypothetical protein
MPKYRKLPVEIEAVQYAFNGRGDNPYATVTEVPPWLSAAFDDGTIFPRSTGYGYKLIVQALEGNMEVHPYAWIIRGVKGELYPCENSIFHLTYEEVKDGR